MKHLVLIDGHHMMYRAYWAIPRTMKTSTGEQVNTVFGMASMLLAILQKEKPDALLVCFDDGDQTFRHQEHTEYKEGRAETPDDFYTQIPRVFDLLTAFGFPVASNPQYEADDIIGAYAKKAEAKGIQTTIVSGDKDLFQLVSDTIRIAIPHKGYQATEYLGPNEVKEKLGVRPDQVPAFKGLSGDSSDNLPGVRGIGPKTAASLLQHYETLDGVYAHLEEITGSQRTKLETDKEQALFCERMAELALDMPLEQPLNALQLQDLPVETVLSLFSELEFTLLTKRLQVLLNDNYGEHFVAGEREKLQKTSEKTEEDQLSLF